MTTQTSEAEVYHLLLSPTTKTSYSRPVVKTVLVAAASEACFLNASLGLITAAIETSRVVKLLSNGVTVFGNEEEVKEIENSADKFGNLWTDQAILQYRPMIKK